MESFDFDMDSLLPYVAGVGVVVLKIMSKNFTAILYRLIPMPDGFAKKLLVDGIYWLVVLAIFGYVIVQIISAFNGDYQYGYEE